MAQDSDQIRVAASGNIFVAPYSDALVLPEDLSALDAAFVDLGYATEDGVTFNNVPNIEDLMGWQKANPLRRLVTSRDSSASFTLMQQNLDTFALAFGGGDWTEPTAGVYRYDPPGDSDALAEYAVVIDALDGDIQDRFVLMRTTVNDAVETQLVRNNSANLPVTLAALTPDGEDAGWYFLSDDPAFQTT